MRLPLLLGAIAAILPGALSLSILPRLNIGEYPPPPWNMPKEATDIPVDSPLIEIMCTGSSLNPNDTAIAKAMAIAWSKGPNKLARRDAVKWAWGKTAIWVCNCALKKHHLDWWAFEEFEKVLAYKCGPNQSGWLWSSDWKKGYNLAPNDGGPKKCPYSCTRPKNMYR